MSKLKERIVLIFADFITINLAWTFYYFVRIESGWIPYTTPASFMVPLIVIYLFWLILFSFSGLYQYWFARSRFEEFSAVVKAVTIGCFILFFVIFLDDVLQNSRAISRFLILIYWFFMVMIVGSGRVVIRSVQRKMLEKGIGLRNTLIVGAGKRGRELEAMVKKFPQLGYKIIGFVSIEDDRSNGILGSINNIREITEKYAVTDILIALEKHQKEMVFQVIKECPHETVTMKILPDTYEIISGMARTNQLYGVPLIEVMPEIMPYGSRIVKRAIDVILSFIMLVFLSPLILSAMVLMRLTSRGSVIYKQTRVGKNGRLFTMYKIRTMYDNAEEYGPEWAGEKDPRITPAGRIIRKIYLDETLQFINVLKNDMSIVGPRPERPEFVEMLNKEISYYYKRLSIKPGITGWAQVKHKYDRSLDDVREKLKYDFYYIENMSLKLDFRIMINTLIVIIFMKGH